jgi:4-hydroxy-2-oxoheptanedioate aldolase
MVQWGPADYSMSLGRIGEWNHPDIKRVERDVFEKCLAAGIQPRLELNKPEDAAPYIEMGVRHFCMNADIYILHDWLKSNGRALRDLVEGVESAPAAAAVGYRGANPGVDAVSPASPGSR